MFILSGHQIVSELRPSAPRIILLADSRDMDSRSKVLLMDGHRGLHNEPNNISLHFIESILILTRVHTFSSITKIDSQGPFRCNFIRISNFIVWTY